MEATLQLILQELRKLGEGQQRLEARMGALETRMDSIENRMDGLESRMDGLESRMNGLESRIDRLERRVDSIETELQEVKRLVRGTFEQVGLLTEFRTEVTTTLARHEKIISRLA